MGTGAVSYRFGSFHLDPAERRLLRNGETIALTPKAFDLLVALVEHAGHLMKKTELLETLWPGVFVEEVNLAQNISAIRRALGGKDKQLYIQTVSGVGYRFISPVRTTASGSTHAGAPVDGGHGRSGTPPPARLIVLPFRMLKADPEIDFLAFSLPDALTASLSSLDSIAVRSSLVAARFAGETADLRKIAEEARVDLVLTGTLLRAGDELRVTAQLADAQAGTLVWTHTEQAPLGDLFRLQDLLVTRIINSLELRLTAREQRALTRDAPSSATGYEFYLRANQIVHGTRWWTNIQTWSLARDLYLQAITDDPRFAPAHAAIGRVYRVMAKYSVEDSRKNFERAEAALARALELNPEQASAETLYAQLEIDLGRARDAMVRLLGRARHRAHDPEPLVGLCQACRYCGLLDESIAAHDRALHLDATIATSVAHTYFVLGDYQRVVELAETSWGGYGYVGLISLARTGRGADALVAARPMEETSPANFRALVVAARTLIDGSVTESVAALDEVVRRFTDPEVFFYAGRQLAHMGELPRALEALGRAVSGGYFGLARGNTDAWFDPIRNEPEFVRLTAESQQARDSALHAFHNAT